MINNYLSIFKFTGNKLFEAGLNNFYSGNISVCVDDLIIITAAGTMLSELEKKDLVMVSLKGNNYNKASSELPVHKEIYKKTEYKAVVHAHPVYTVVNSLKSKGKIDLIDGEGNFYFPHGIPVLECKNTVASEEVALKIPEHFNTSPAVIVKGHGIFSCANTVEGAAKWISAVEHSMKILYLKKNY
ncbi:MAG: class II aldolase/adducin family protein [Candidatus Muiribacteriota bacterium]